MHAESVNNLDESAPSSHNSVATAVMTVFGYGRALAAMDAALYQLDTVATTVRSYATPLMSPVTVHAVAGVTVLQVCGAPPPAGTADTVYPTTAPPFAGGVHDASTAPSPDEATRSVGGSSVAVRNEFDPEDADARYDASEADNDTDARAASPSKVTLIADARRELDAARRREPRRTTPRTMRGRERNRSEAEGLFTNHRWRSHD